MKKLLFTALTAVFLISSAFATPVKNVNNQVKRNFENSFRNVSDVEWKVTANYAKATFILNNVRTEAFYTAAGDLIGTSHAITIDDLPTFAKRIFAKKYSNYTVSEAIQFDGTEETAYYVSAFKDDKKVVLRINNGTMSEM